MTILISTQAHQEIVVLINKISNLKDSHKADGEFSEFTRDLTRLARLAFSAAKHNNVKLACDIIDAGTTLLEYAHATAICFAQKTVDVVGAGITVFNALTHPLRTARKISNALQMLYDTAFDHDLYEYSGDFRSLHELVKDPDPIKHYESVIDVYRKRGLSDLDIEIYIARAIKFNTRVEALGNAVQQMGNDILAMSNQELYAAGVDAMLDFFLWNKLIGAIGRVIPPAQQALVRAADTLKSKGDKATAAQVATALGKAEATAAQLPRVVEQAEASIAKGITKGEKFITILQQSIANNDRFTKLGLRTFSKRNLEHIFNRHMPGRSALVSPEIPLFAENIDLLEITLEAWAKGIEIKSGERIFDFKKIIGTCNGIPTSKVKVVLTKTKDTIRTVFPTL